MTKDEALLIAINSLRQGVGLIEVEFAMKACKEALEKPTQKPVAWMNDIAYSDEIDNLPANRGEIIPLYAHPATSWQGLSDDEMIFIAKNNWDENDFMVFGCAIEQALKEKNL